MSERSLTEPRRFYVQYGTVGPGHRGTKSSVGELHQVRRVAMAVARTAGEAYSKARGPRRNELAAKLLEQVHLSFLEAHVGPLLDGYVIEWTIPPVTRYIAIIPEGKGLSDCATTDRGAVDGEQIILPTHNRLGALQQQTVRAPAKVPGGQIYTPEVAGGRRSRAEQAGARMAEAALKAVRDADK